MATDPATFDPSRLVAVLGGGQLGRMLGFAGNRINVTCKFLDPSPVASAIAAGELLVGELNDFAAVARLAKEATVLTYEWEGVDPGAIVAQGNTPPVRPSVRALKIARDRGQEKQLLRDLDIPLANFAVIENEGDIEAALNHVGFPAVLKTQFGGYDGKGQARVNSLDELSVAVKGFAGAPLTLEELVLFTRELSLIAVRSLTGETVYYPLVENLHADGILRITRAPALDLMGSLEGMQDQQKIAEGYARSILDELDYVGVLTLELFEGNDQLLVNEIAPRVHNSGHWTIEGAQCSQFENHLRAILGDPLGSPEAIGASAMVNCLGVMPDPEALNSLPDTYLHDYGKDLRPNRKVGHVTITATDNRVVEEQLLELRKIAPEIFLGLDASTHRSSGV